eukprot:350660-Chlamydomonas_euryale.AAC.3
MQTAHHQNLETTPDEATPTLAIAFWALLKKICTWAVALVDGGEGRSLNVKASLRQGCIAAPTRFEAIVDHFLQEALSQLPPGKHKPRQASFAFKIFPSRAVHGRQIFTLALRRLRMPTIWRC